MYVQCMCNVCAMYVPPNTSLHTLNSDDLAEMYVHDASYDFWWFEMFFERFGNIYV